ncbi:MAG: hypothetical protein P4M11_08395 [Candidatus Pacebacteria bacterium]|nr:hypothetical protein [Candidatus Paceibacterota bacterium]
MSQQVRPPFYSRLNIKTATWLHGTREMFNYEATDVRTQEFAEHSEGTMVRTGTQR